MSGLWKPPGSYVFGTGADQHVIVPARVAAILFRRAGLADYHRQNRGIDPELDSLLVALREAGREWVASVSGSEPRKAAEPESLSSRVSAREAADLLGVTDRAVRLACTQGRIPAEQVDGRWLIDREDVEHYRAARDAA